MKIYTASSWRNPFYDGIVASLKAAGHDVYDFKTTISTHGKTVAFNWNQCDENWENWDFSGFMKGLEHPLAKNAFAADKNGMDTADIGVLVLPCGSSAHLEAGYMVGRGKPVYVLLPPGVIRAELTYKLATKILSDNGELVEELEHVR